MKHTILSLTASLLTLAASATAAEKPNILFILVDDLGVKDTSYSGSKVYETPAMDTLAKDGMNFVNAYAAHPRCLPSRYGIFSGRIPGRDGVPGFQEKGEQPLPLHRVTWGELLKKAGYSTGYIGKWHLGGHGGEPNFQGFTDSRIAGHAGSPPSYFYPYHIARHGKSKELFPPIKGEKGEYLTDRLTNEAIDFITKNKDKPFALVLAHYAVHTPLEAPAETTQHYAKKIKALGREVAHGSTDKDFVTVGNGSFKTVQNNPTYAAMIDRVDHGITKIRTTLKKLGLDKKTIIILTSDHGGLSTRYKGNNRAIATSNLPYRNGKGWLYDGGLRVPMLVVWPGHVQPGSVTKTQTVGFDHYATILEMAGVKLPENVKIDSVSYLPALEGKEPKRPAMLFHSPLGRPTQTGDHPASALIDGDWKIFQRHDTLKYELYNISKDIGEKENLAEKEPAKLKEMIEKLKQAKIKAGTKQYSPEKIQARIIRSMNKKKNRKNQ